MLFTNKQKKEMFNLKDPFQASGPGLMALQACLIESLTCPRCEEIAVDRSEFVDIFSSKDGCACRVDPFVGFSLTSFRSVGDPAPHAGSLYQKFLITPIIHLFGGIVNRPLD